MQQNNMEEEPISVANDFNRLQSLVESNTESEYTGQDTSSRFKLSKSHFLRFNPKCWLNDELVNGYSSLLQEKLKFDQKKRRVYCVTTYFQEFIFKRDFSNL